MATMLYGMSMLSFNISFRVVTLRQQKMITDRVKSTLKLKE